MLNHMDARGVGLNRRGVALPLALLGLVAVSLMVTTALLTSSTQSAIAGAQQKASQNLYEADAVLENFLASRANMLADTPSPLIPVRTTFNGASGTPYNVAVALVSRQQDTTAVTPRQVTRNDVFSIFVTPQTSGRSVGALFTTQQTWYLGQLSINSAGSVAANLLKIPGNAGAMSGVDLSGCSDMHTGTSGGTGALAISDSVRLDLDTARVLESEEGYANVTRTNMTRYEFAMQILGGLTPEQLALAANILWGNDLPGPNGTTVDGRTLGSSLTPDPSKSRSTGLNWGCPNTEAKLEGRQSGMTCNSPADTGYYPVIAVNSPGGNFKIQGSGQGFLLVFGDADLRDLNFFGVVIVTGDVQLNGTGYIGGAFVALGDATLGREYQESDPDEVNWNGRTFVRFNRCGLNAAQAALGQQNGATAEQTFTNRTRSWFEVVR